MQKKEPVVFFSQFWIGRTVSDVKDLDSTNGTLVNGQPIASVQLRSGDRIRFGKVEACYECEMAGSGNRCLTWKKGKRAPPS